MPSKLSWYRAKLHYSRTAEWLFMLSIKAKIR